MNPITANPVIVLMDAHNNRSRGDRRGNRDRAVHAARSARQALEQIRR